MHFNGIKASLTFSTTWTIYLCSLHSGRCVETKGYSGVNLLSARNSFGDVKARRPCNLSDFLGIEVETVACQLHLPVKKLLQLKH